MQSVAATPTEGLVKLGTYFEVLYWCWIATEVVLQIVTRTSRKQGDVRDRGSLILLLPVIFFSVWVAEWYGATRPPNMPGSGLAYHAVALALIALGLVVRWTAVITLGAAFSTNVAIHATQKLRTTGLFRWVRHPSYTGMVIIFVAVGLWQQNWVSLATVVIFPIVALLYRIHVEELALHEAFGQQYADYSRTTRRLIPGVY